MSSESDGACTGKSTGNMRLGAAAGVCNTIGSPVQSSGTNGNSVINFAGPINTPFIDPEMAADVVAWDEL